MRGHAGSESKARRLRASTYRHGGRSRNLELMQERESRARLRIFTTILTIPILVLAGCTEKTDWRADSLADENYREWRQYQGDSSNSQYSTLDQVNRENVRELQVAWVYHTADKRDNNRSQIQCNPIVIDGVLYGTSARGRVFALNASNGEQLWAFDPFEAREMASAGVNRGVNYWEDGDDKRVLVCAGHYLFSLNAKTGSLIPDFGEEGTVNLREGLGRDIGELYMGSRTPGIVYKDLLIQGTVVMEGPGPSAPGHIRAYHIPTGELRWIFHTIPHPGEFGYDTWPEDAWTRVGGANSWSGLGLDEARGLVFASTGSPAFDFWGGNRKGENLFGNCVLALKADTGERVWHFQTVHHDLWDRDHPAPPNLVTVEHDGRRIDAVAQITKTGQVFVFNRETGEPLFPIEERPVPPSDLRGEEAWPTQPFPTRPPPFSRQTFTEADITDISPHARTYVEKRFEAVRKGHMFNPPSTEGTLVFPGFDGGGEWGGAAYDPTTGILYANSNEMPWILTMVDLAARGGEVSAGETVYTVYCAVCHGVGRQSATRLNAPSLQEIRTRERQQRTSRATARQVIKDGRAFMPGFGHLSESEREAVLGFLYGASGRRAIVSAPPEIPYTHTGFERFLDEEGYPAIAPPWGQLSAIDLDRGEILWQIPLGELPELTDKGIPVTGTENYGGPVVTAGGLVFIAATKDEKFRAFDKETGELLWETQLPAGGYATPSTFEIDGKQFVVIAAGGGKIGTKSGDAYVAFALPQ